MVSRTHGYGGKLAALTALFAQKADAIGQSLLSPTERRAALAALAAEERLAKLALKREERAKRDADEHDRLTALRGRGALRPRRPQKKAAHKPQVVHTPR
jgi:hypothetical protein